jgi:hypothetical protein
MSALVVAPFTPEQVASLNAYQEAGVMHPFTCDNEMHGSREFVLVATETGWRCRSRWCDYYQTWAHAAMADWSWQPQPAGKM